MSSSNDGRSHFGRFAKGRRRHSDKDSDKFRKTDQLPMMVSQCPAACPACLGTHIGLGHRLCHQRPAGHQWTPMDTNGHQWTPELLVCQKTSDKASARPGHCWPTPIIMEICTKNDLFGAAAFWKQSCVRAATKAATFLSTPAQPSVSPDFMRRRKRPL